jgi:HAD superfamily hydrolase (TIGR01509 family)
MIRVPDKACRDMASVGIIEFPKDGFEAVIFDCDGTLVDSMPAHFDAWCEALAEFGAGGIFKEDVFFAMGGRPTRDIVVDLNSEYGLKLDPEAVALSKQAAFLRKLDQITLIDEVAEFAKSLRGKMPMAIATGGSRMVIEKTLKMIGASDWFDEVVTADDVSEGKPAPDIFLKAAELMRVPPAKCLVIEDAPPGVIAAQAAGMQVVTIPMPLLMA